MHSKTTSAVALVCLIGVLTGCQTGAAAPLRSQDADELLGPCEDRRLPAGARCGTYEVWEDRAAQSGRRLGLNVVVLPARDPRPELGAWVLLVGGPGAAATLRAPGLVDSWQREHHDILLVDQRGTGASNPLTCDLSRPGDTAQTYLEGPFVRRDEFAACAQALAARADLRLYTTPIAMDDLNEVRAALGYELVNLSGGSYGSRAALVYMRRHPDTVRTAVINGIAPIAFTNPLYHSSEAHNALQTTLAECAADTACSAAFPDLGRKFDELLQRLEDAPATVAIDDPDTGRPTQVVLNRAGFAESLRVFMYSMPRARRVPLLIHRAWEGDYAPFAEAGINSTRGLSQILAIGMLQSVICAEDIPRIDPALIDAVTSDTFLGSERVLTQMAACDVWPRGAVPDNYGDPVQADVPTLILSGTHDPVTGSGWGEVAAGNLPDSLHLIVPAAHGVSGQCVRSIIQDFVASAELAELDTSCVVDVELPPFALQ
jgi:pimeloyl-ACP methyl ester carboxylesterase